jgi:archaellum component FlaC
MDWMATFFDSVAKLVELLRENKAETAIAFFMVYFLLSMYWARKDRGRSTERLESMLASKEAEHTRVLQTVSADAESKDKRISALLEQRHQQFVDVFDRVTTSLTGAEQTLGEAADKVEDLEEKTEALGKTVAALGAHISTMDSRCQTRQEQNHTMCTDARGTDSERRRRGGK